MSTLTVESVGVLALLQDRGRNGFAHLGVGRSGAADRASYDLANRLVGNRPGAACIEATLGRLTFRVDATVLIAVTGAPVTIRCGTRAQAVNTSFTARAGDTVTLSPPTVGLRTYVAVRGGIRGEEVLGSASWDTMAHLGTPPLRAGAMLPVADAAADWPATDLAPVAAMDAGSLQLPLLLGPRDDWFTDAALDLLAGHDFTVTPDTDRVGMRLDGPQLPRLRCGELASEGVVLGALQVPTRGRPTLFLADRPVTGGYPVIGVVPKSGVDRAAQAVPGMRVRFKPFRVG
ncbi:biotin-dependent carboxyltransferase family protein [Mycobacterium sp. 21AC1]|uniref:5-oxoprolinase subunit C family protein n=1 Tax=[Mycobacterium] appelbergii TaxID=2939269 RepID=UPI00293903AE|nr:biotin-dependent carboxyltransferase family protein [Mycobacterium sp. 21AC1]MDV3123599.1 biotin-dependent carboxyltransferase family protein [Mycobacterium sp. 21AC1]